MDIRDVFLGDVKQTRVYVGSELVIGTESSPLDLAPAHNQPTVTTQPLSQWGPPSIPGSTGWWREKRQDAQECGPGDNQSSTSPLDLDGSSFFAYPCVPPPVDAHAANEAGYVTTGFKPGGAPQNAKWLFNLRFVTSSPTVEFRFRSAVTNPDFGLLLVDGLRVQERTVTQTLGEAGIGYSTTLEFPDSRDREILVYGLNNVGGNFGGVAVQPGYTVRRPATQPAKTVAIIGDSYTNGHNTVSSTETFVWPLAMAMGGDCILQAGIGGTGFLKQLEDSVNSQFLGRLNDVYLQHPDILIFAGGRNDGGFTAAEIQAQAEFLITYSAVPADRIIIIPTASEASQPEVRAALATAALNTGARYLDVAIDSLPKITDGIHPTWQGHQQLATQAAALWNGDTPTPQPYTITDMEADITASRPVYWAHRGGSANWSEMTSYAYRNAVSWGARCLEFSARRTDDGVWVGIHNATADAATGGVVTGNVRDLTWSQLEGVEVVIPSGGGTITRLDDFLTEFTDQVLICDPKTSGWLPEEFFPMLKSVPNWQERIIVKLDGQWETVATFQAAKAAGFKVAGYWYPNNYAANLPDREPYTDYIGMQWDASSTEWADVLAYGKPVWGHVLQGQSQFDAAATGGASIFQCADVIELIPHI